MQRMTGRRIGRFQFLVCALAVLGATHLILSLYQALVYLHASDSVQLPTTDNNKNNNNNNIAHRKENDLRHAFQTKNSTSILQELRGLNSPLARPIPLDLRLAAPTRANPLIVVGYPKSGTTSIWNFFNCSAIQSQHYCCCNDWRDHPPCASQTIHNITYGSPTMALCLLTNIAHSKSLLQDCGDYAVYAQLDGERPVMRMAEGYAGVLLNNGTYEPHDRSVQGQNALFRHFLPQHFHLDLLHAAVPNAVFVLPLRDPLVWAKSANNWFHMRGRFVNEFMEHDPTIQRPGPQRALEFLSRIYVEHTRHVREFVRKHPSHVLIEVNLTSETAGNDMARVFGLDAECWGHHNKVGNRSNLIQNKEYVDPTLSLPN
jgi:hypothetical protein